MLKYGILICVYKNIRTIQVNNIVQVQGIMDVTSEIINISIYI